jgi:hypothetical protein
VVQCKSGSIEESTSCDAQTTFPARSSLHFPAPSGKRHRGVVTCKESLSSSPILAEDAKSALRLRTAASIDATFSENNFRFFRVLLVFANLHLMHTQAVDHQCVDRQCSLNMAQRAATCTNFLSLFNSKSISGKQRSLSTMSLIMLCKPPLLVSFALQLIFIILISPNNTVSAANFSQCPNLGPEVVTCTSPSLQNVALASSVLKERRPLRSNQAHLEALEVYTLSRAV